MNSFEKNSEKSSKIDKGNKRQAKVIPMEEVQNELQKYGRIISQEHNYKTGAYTFVFEDNQGNEFIVICPASRWRRDENLYPRQPSDLNALASEIRVLLLSPTTTAAEKKATDLFREYIHTILQNGPTQGEEIEYFVSPEHYNEIMTQAEEAHVNMREGQTDVVRGIPELRKELTRFLKETVDQLPENAPLWFGGFYPDSGKNIIFDEGLRIYTPEQDAERCKDNPAASYLFFTLRAFQGRIREHIGFSPELTLENWDEVARSFGYKNASALLEDRHFNVWTTAAAHYSIGIPHFKENGQAPGEIFVHLANLMNRYYSITTNQNESGGLAYGIPLTVPDQKTDQKKTVTGARSIASAILPTSLPGRFMKNVDDLRQAMLDGCMSGGTNTPDRGLPIEIIDNAGFKTIFSAQHGPARARASASWDGFKSVQENADYSNLGNALRMEDTSRSETPDIFGGNIQSVALQNLLYLIGNLAATEEGGDVFGWMQQNGILSDAERAKSQADTMKIWHEKEQALIGNFDMEKVNELFRMIRFAEQKIRILCEKNELELNPHWEDVLKFAKRALINIRKQAKIWEYVDNNQDYFKNYSAQEKLHYFRGDDRNGEFQSERSLGCYGLFVNSLTDSELRELLEYEYQLTSDPIDQTPISELKRGRLEFLLSGCFVRDSLQKELQAINRQDA